MHERLSGAEPLALIRLEEESYEGLPCLGHLLPRARRHFNHEILFAPVPTGALLPPLLRIHGLLILCFGERLLPAEDDVKDHPERPHVGLAPVVHAFVVDGVPPPKDFRGQVSARGA